MSNEHLTGGCLCGALRYETKGGPAFSGHCYCADCRKASGSGFIPFMQFAADDVTITGDPVMFRSRSFRGSESVRNFCPVCGGLVFGGEIGKTSTYTIYGGSLDDPSRFKPQIAIFAASRPPWALIPPGLRVFDQMPSERPS